MQCPILQDVIYEDERCVLFIDGPSLYQTCRSLDVEIDYGSLRNIFADAGYLVQARYYTNVLSDQSYTPIRPLVDWLSYNGFVVVTKPVNVGHGADEGYRRDHGIGVELAVDAIEISPKLDHAILFTSNGDMLRLVQLLQRRAVRTTVVGTTRGVSAMISDDLRRQSDGYIDLQSLMPFIRRERHQPAGLRRAG
ncbi:MAG: NYN domain-containing protein [Geminicoccaceae bacterium]